MVAKTYLAGWTVLAMIVSGTQLAIVARSMGGIMKAAAIPRPLHAACARATTRDVESPCRPIVQSTLNSSLAFELRLLSGRLDVREIIYMGALATCDAMCESCIARVNSQASQNVSACMFEA